MGNTIIVGAQWGDEGKGKIVDFLTESADVVIRAQGGNNAGHTVICNGQKYILHLMPSGILWPGKTCVIGNGVALDPVGLSTEIAGLEAKGVTVDPGRLLISDCAHLTLPHHRAIDRLRESGLGAKKLGTTGRGIGPTYTDKAQRIGLRVADASDPSEFRDRLVARMEEVNRQLDAAGQPSLEIAPAVTEVMEALDRLRPHVTNTVAYLHRAMAEEKNLLFEGAQGTFLDIDYGTYPFVTSSNTTAGGACTGSGVPPNRIDRIIGVCKGYTTRVGTGPFPTENDEFGDFLHGLGREFGATTGRERRCGWLDLVLLRQAAMINGFDEWAVTNLDGLDSLDTVRLCVAYEIDGQRCDLPPARFEKLQRAQPVYEELPGWKTDLSSVSSWDDLPSAARDYLERIATLTGVPIGTVGVGPDRVQTILRQPARQDTATPAAALA